MALITGRASADIDMPIDGVWAIVQDVESAPAWQQGIDTMVALERDADGRPLVCETTTDAKLVKVRTTVRFTYGGPARLSWARQSGDVKSMDGAWALADLGDGRTRATYELEIDPGHLGMFLHGSTKDRLLELLVTNRPNELKARAEQE